MAKKQKTPMEYYLSKADSMDATFPQLGTVVRNLTQYPQLSHSSNLLAKAAKLHQKMNRKSVLVLNKLIQRYLEFYEKITSIHIYNDDAILERATELDNYYQYFEDEKIESTFDSRSKIRSTVLEEFTYLYLRDKVDEIVNSKCGEKSPEIKCGATKAYSNLYITGRNLESFVDKPLVKINDKDQDYAIFREIPIVIPGMKQDDAPIAETIANVPILAIENKTFLDKTMLEGAVATAEKLKSGNPYSTFIVVTETYAVSEDVDPIYSRIDQIFVLRKCKHNSKNRMPDKIKPEVLKKLVDMVERRLTGTWSDVGKRMSNDGVII